jgi:hypothetical protein
VGLLAVSGEEKESHAHEDQAGDNAQDYWTAATTLLIGDCSELSLDFRRDLAQ